MEQSQAIWLLEGPGWMQYRVQRDLFLHDSSQPELGRAALLANAGIRELVMELQDWPGMPLTSHKSAGHPLHKLVFLADVGLQASDPGMEAIIDRILTQASKEGPFRVLANVPKHFGGSGVDELAWALCDAPLVIYALARFGLGEHPAVQRAAEFLVGLVRETGWPCKVSAEMGRFHGPGRKGDPCPYATLVMLQALAEFSAYSGCRDHPAARVGVEALLSLWENRREQHPYLFYMGTDFCKLKAPLVWYDLLHVLDVLTRFSWALDDPRLLDMAAILRGKANAQEQFVPESVWMAWKDWEFGQKKVPSRWVTFLAARIEQRIQTKG